MILCKVTVGTVVQKFDTDLQKFVSQEFIASDEVSYETEDEQEINYSDFMDRIIGDEPYLPFEMKQPE